MDTAQRYWWAGHEGSLPDGLEWLSGAERARLGTMRFTKRRTEYLLRRWVGKRALAAHLGLDTDAASLARIEVLNRVSGAPHLVLDGAPAPWEISLSDRAGCAVALVAALDGDEPAPVGIDLEVVEPRSPGFVADFLTPAEQARLPGATDDGPLGRDAAVNLVWSAKEAALKVLRLGLRADTRWVEVDVATDRRPDGWARLTITWRDGRELPGWWRRDGCYLLTVAAGHDLDPPQLLPGAADLTTATPVHSWVDRPVVIPEG